MNISDISDDEIEDWAEEWGVSVDEAEDLIETILERGVTPFELMSEEDRRDYIDSLHEALEADGLDVDVSDLWALACGYEPRGR